MNHAFRVQKHSKLASFQKGKRESGPFRDGMCIKKQNEDQKPIRIKKKLENLERYQRKTATPPPPPPPRRRTEGSTKTKYPGREKGSKEGRKQGRKKNK